jgi:hypothetical protein
MENLLLRPVKYKHEQTARGARRSFMYPNGLLFTEYMSHARLFGLPLVHTTRGICPETGRRVVARGVVAVGRRAVGVVAIGQLAVGLVAVGQLSLGGLCALGQAAFGPVAVGQAAVAAAFAAGQFAAAAGVAIGQFSAGAYALGQIGFGKQVWDTRGADPVARQFFRGWLGL